MHMQQQQQVVGVTQGLLYHVPLLSQQGTAAAAAAAPIAASSLQLCGLQYSHHFSAAVMVSQMQQSEESLWTLWRQYTEARAGQGFGGVTGRLLTLY